jgi:pyruvate dehydrogenase E2 component (dihydrolipoamide acetyltransferase)
MAHILIMSRQGNTVESCIITDWKVKEGDSVSADTVVCEVETDKAAFELPAGAAGVVLKILRNAGDDVPVLEPIAVIGEAGEVVEDFYHEANQRFVHEQTREDFTQRHKDTKGIDGMVPEIHPNTAISPRAKGLADKEGLAAEGLQGGGPGGRVIEREGKAALEARPPLTAAALAATSGKAALPETGSGLAGRVTVEDLDSSRLMYTDTPVKGIRKIISDRMLKSLAETAQFTLNAQAPVGRLQDIRERMKADGVKYKSVPSVNDFVLFAVSRVLPQFAYMNAHFLGSAIRTFNCVHLGHAVDTPRGLMVPVIKNANLLALPQISAEAKRLAAACKDGNVKPEELAGSTFTVSNLGSLGVTSFTPVLNVPEVGILGVCAITDGALVDGAWLRPTAGAWLHPHIGFSLTINHQAVDGAPAARFLKALCDAVADIDLLLMEG